MRSTERSRRRFLTDLLGACLAGPAALRGWAADGPRSASFSPIRKALPNPFVHDGKPIVALVRGTDFPAMLAKALDLLGGGFARFGTGRSVIVKPNFVFDKRTSYPTTTDEASVLTTVQTLQREGFADITVADRRANRGANRRAGGKFEWSGLNDLAERGGFRTDSLMDDSTAPTVTVRDRGWSDLPSVGVIQKVYEAGLIVNMPTIKRHTNTNLTCSLKNMMGVLDVPTTELMHLWGDENQAARDVMSRAELDRRLCRTIAEAAMAVSPEVTVIDARKVLCTDHLSVRTGTPKEADCVIVSGDPVAADVVAARVLAEVHPEYDLGPTTETFRRAAALGVGIAARSQFVLREARSG